MNINKLSEFQDTFNPQHFYCRLRELEIKKEDAKRWAEIYEIGIYDLLMEEIKYGTRNN